VSVRLHVLAGGRLRSDKGLFTPGRDEGVRATAPVACFLIRHPQGLALFDTGCHPEVATDPFKRWGGLAKAFRPEFTPEETVVPELGRLGLGADDVDLVVCSHLHMDHCGANAFFRRATCVVQARELATARDPKSEGKGYFRADWDHPMPFREVEGEQDLFGDGRLVVVPVPGHTPGMMMAAVGLDRTGTMLLASDAVIVRANLDEDLVPRNTWDAEAWRRSAAEIRRWQARGAFVVFGHDAEQWAALKKGPDAYE
jgi:glyoxylase-like metal-dependent hydrolase (beta-lactamase superfamily II)